MDKFEARLMDAAQAVVDSADSEGCSEDLTVVSQETIDELSEALTIYKVEILSRMISRKDGA